MDEQQMLELLNPNSGGLSGDLQNGQGLGYNIQDKPQVDNTVSTEEEVNSLFVALQNGADINDILNDPNVSDQAKEIIMSEVDSRMPQESPVEPQGVAMPQGANVPNGPGPVDMPSPEIDSHMSPLALWARDKAMAAGNEQDMKQQQDMQTQQQMQMQQQQQ